MSYTGDIRGHGRKAAAFERLLAEPPAPVHAILMEGTSFRVVDPDDSDSVERDSVERDSVGRNWVGRNWVGRGSDGSTPADSGRAADSVADATEPAPELASLTESDVEFQLAETLRATTGLVVVLGSAQNIDQFVTVYRATLRADRDLVVDLVHRGYRRCHRPAQHPRGRPGVAKGSRLCPAAATGPGEGLR